jgi:hypothetical protein
MDNRDDSAPEVRFSYAHLDMLFMFSRIAGLDYPASEGGISRQSEPVANALANSLYDASSRHSGCHLRESEATKRRHRLKTSGL